MTENWLVMRSIRERIGNANGGAGQFMLCCDGELHLDLALVRYDLCKSTVHVVSAYVFRLYAMRVGPMVESRQWKLDKWHITRYLQCGPQCPLAISTSFLFIFAAHLSRIAKYRLIIFALFT